MDVLRENQRNGEREINHHGLTISVENADADKKVFQPRNQMSDEDGAPKNILRRGIDKFRKLTNITLLEISEFAAKKGIPIVVILPSAHSIGRMACFSSIILCTVWNKHNKPLFAFLRGSYYCAIPVQLIFQYQFIS